ncbi:MAG: DUF4169 family protein [Paracoccaceae bacterium]
MVKIVNLRTLRKQKTRALAAEKTAVQAKSAGVKKDERTRVARINALVDKSLDGRKQDAP